MLLTLTKSIAALLVAVCLVNASATVICEAWCGLGHAVPAASKARPSDKPACHASASAESTVVTAATGSCEHGAAEESLRAERSARELRHGVIAATPHLHFVSPDGGVMTLVGPRAAPPSTPPPFSLPLRI